jgi:hypothetical protein
MASPNPKSTPKTISSRLLSMKFMQRAVASGSSSPATPKSEEEHSSKRRKFSHAPSRSEPVTPIIDHEAVQAALQEEEKKRQAAIEKQAAELGDSHWVLDVPVPAGRSGGGPQKPLNVVQVGFAHIDTTNPGEGSSPESLEPKAIPAAVIFRRFNMKAKTEAGLNLQPERISGLTGKQINDNASDSDSDESDASDSDLSGSSSSGRRRQNTRGREHITSEGSRKRARSDLSSRRSAENAKAHHYADKRRKKDINLNKLTSISSQGGQPASSSSVKCYRCGKPGHRANQCKPKQ